MLSIKARLLEEQKHQNQSASQQGERPPELDREEGICGDESRKGRTRDGAEQKRHVEDVQRTATLVQKEHVDDNARTDHGRHCAEEAGEQPRHDIGDVVIWFSHDRRPDLRDHCTQNTPEDHGASTE